MAKTLNIGSVISPVNLGITNGSIADKNGSFGAEKQILCSDGEKIE